MSQRDDWKDTGKGLGSAFKGLGKSIVRTAKTGVDKAVDWAEGKPAEAPAQETEQTADGAAAATQASGTESGSNVFNDGTWRETGKELGGAFKGLGQNILNTTKVGGDKISGKVGRKSAVYVESVVVEPVDAGSDQTSEVKALEVKANPDDSQA